jgi:hypothetical protein
MHVSWHCIQVVYVEHQSLIDPANPTGGWPADVIVLLLDARHSTKPNVLILPRLGAQQSSAQAMHCVLDVLSRYLLCPEV